jgi:hypothetical protein
LYDLTTKTQQRLTHSPQIIEGSLAWLDNQTLAYLTPQSFLISWGEPTQRSNQWFGLSSFDIESGEITVLNTIPYSENANLSYLNRTNTFVISDYQISTYLDTYRITTREGEEIKEIIQPDYFQCKVLDTPNYWVLCWRYDWGFQQIEIIKDNSGELHGFDDITAAPDESKTKRVGRAIPDGYVILDVETNTIRHYSEDTTLIQTLFVPNLSDIFTWETSEIIFTPRVPSYP